MGRGEDEARYWSWNDNWDPCGKSSRVMRLLPASMRNSSGAAWRLGLVSVLSWPALFPLMLTLMVKRTFCAPWSDEAQMESPSRDSTVIPCSVRVTVHVPTL